MKRKGILSAAALLTAASLITGCSVPQKDTTTYKVATITDTGGVNDQAFNQLAWEGLQRFSEETGAEVSYIESKQASDYITNLDRATDGFNDLIWGTGFAMADSIATVARMNPDISFALIDNQVPDAPFNVTSVIFRAEEPSFIVGYIAGRTTHTGKVGYVGAVRTDTSMQCLFIISHGTLNSQAAVGTGYVKSSHSAGVNTGGTNAYGFDSEVIRTSAPAYMTDQEHQVKCLGLEDFWGNYWEFIDGLTSDANRNVMTCDIAKNFVTNGTGYKNNGNGGVTANIANYMKLPQGGSNAGFTARDVSGSDSTYFTDYAYLYASCLAIFGGCWSAALDAGAFQLYVANAFSLSAVSVGCRLMFMHKEEPKETEEEAA